MIILYNLLNNLIIYIIIYRIHICITHLHTKPGVASLFIEDLKQELIEILKTPNIELTGKVNNKLFNQIRVFFLILSIVIYRWLCMECLPHCQIEL